MFFGGTNSLTYATITRFTPTNTEKVVGYQYYQLWQNLKLCQSVAHKFG
ncbi:hypothetical protein HMPREF1320_1153 [Capnocytophaga sp. oral taxon 335 str. F0486]|nr:hypothetical protein HMPREF1320_1153 [Capnocytophaga sp. oral taxon 335 str. F0486]